MKRRRPTGTSQQKARQRGLDRQNRFILDAAHELRTPLTTLRTAIELLHGSPQPSIEEYHATTTLVERGIGQLERLIDDMLLLASDTRLQMGDEVALGPILEEVLADLAPLAREYQVALRTQGEAGLAVPSNGALLSRIFTNLIENGIRYNHAGGEVSVVLERQDTWAVVHIADTGIGIAQEQQAYIFQRFYRSEQAKQRHQRGSGLGLAIVTHIVQQHGGTVEVASVPEQGSRFTVRLPMQRLTPTLSPPCYPPHVRQPRRRRISDNRYIQRRNSMSTHILIVDDAPDMRHIIAQLFRLAGFEPSTAPDGATALEMFRHEQPDIILLDLGLPDMDGLEVCRRIRSDSQVPIVMLTKCSGEHDRVAGLKAGADDYISKPFIGEELILRVRAVLRRGQS